MDLCRAALLASTLALLAFAACARTNDAHAQKDGGVARGPVAVEASTLLTVDVPGDQRVLVVVGNPSVRRPIVHLHGMCGDPKNDLEAWGGVSKEHGTIVALAGDVPCPGRPGRSKWALDAGTIDARITAAIDAVNEAKGTNLDGSEVLVVGESMGAARAELLARERPSRYTRLVLVGSPQAPSPANLRSARAVASLAGEREPQHLMKSGAKLLEEAGTPARFWELTGASHGEYGPDGERIMGEAIAFVATSR